MCVCGPWVEVCVLVHICVYLCTFLCTVHLFMNILLSSDLHRQKPAAKVHYTKWVWANLWCATMFHCCLGIYQTLRHWCKNGPHSLKSCWIVYIWMSVCVCVCVWVRQCSQVTYLMINGFKVHSSSWKLDSLLYESQYCCTVHAVFVSMCACTYIYIHITNVL